MDLSVIIPSYNAAATVQRAIVSCLASLPASNVFVVLDGADAALEAAARGVEGVRVIARPERSGAPACRNAGLELVKTSYVMFLDADDYIEGPLLDDAQRIARKARADLVLGRFAFEYPSGERVTRDPRETYAGADNDGIMKRWLLHDYTPPCAVVWRADFVRQLGGWDETLAKNQDGDLIYRALMAQANVVLGGEGAGVYVQSPSPQRITNQRTASTLASEFAVLEKLRAALPRLAEDIGPALASAYYDLARHAYTARQEALGETAERTARELGVEGEPGALAHTVLASVLGLRAKQRLAHMVRSALAA